MKIAQNIIGKRFGRLIVVKRTSKPGAGAVRWQCRCDCGGETNCSTPVLEKGKSRSCGCLANELTAARSRTHGGSKTAEYRTWCSIISRCENPRQPSFERYGARGIKICKRWRNSFSAFISDMGNKPFPRATIDRMDNLKGYSPDNCRWADYKTQAANMRSNHLISFAGETKILTAWAIQYGIKQPTLRRRLKKGWPTEKALMAPLWGRL